MHYTNGMSKQPTSVRLSDTAKRLVKKIAAKLGISQAAVLEIAIREKAEKERIQDDDPR